jgi:hypothetical protein
MLRTSRFIEAGGVVSGTTGATVGAAAAASAGAAVCAVSCCPFVVAQPVRAIARMDGKKYFLYDMMSHPCFGDILV